MSSRTKVYIAPYSTMTKTFQQKYLDKNIEFLGFIDSAKEGENIYKIDDLNTSEYDYIYIVSPNHGVKIHQYFKQKGITSKVLKHFDYDNNSFELISYQRLLYNELKKKYSLKLQQHLHLKWKHLFEKQDAILLLAPDFIDINLKALYVYIENHTEYKVSIATNNKEQYRHFLDARFDVVLYPSLKFLYKSLRAKYKILDHNPVHDELFISLINSYTVQIWHGITIKKLGHMTNYKKVKYDLMISTSDFVTEYSFSKLFDYKNIINAGYPRNDILINGVQDEKDLIMANKSIYEFVKNSDKKVVIYMPTWRPYADVKNPINLNDLNTFCQENNILFIIKTHPFTRNNSFYDTSFDEYEYIYTQGYQNNVLFYPTTDDIYPLLGLSDLLITDYSSIYFDYLLLDKPILFFVYDKDIYLKEHGDFMLDFDEYTPGEKVCRYDELKTSIQRNIQTNQYHELRDYIKNKFLQIKGMSSSKTIVDFLKT